MPYEEEILRNPFSVKCWLRYVEHKKNASDASRNLVYERALKELPGRYSIMSADYFVLHELFVVCLQFVYYPVIFSKLCTLPRVIGSY